MPIWKAKAPSSIRSICLALATAPVITAAQVVAPLAAASAPARLVIAKPVHSIGYLPLYVGIRQGFFSNEGLRLEVLTVQGGAAHTNAVLTGQAWAFIGGPEHNAFAKLRGAELRAVTNVVNRGNVYLVARSDLLPLRGELPNFFRGKRIAVSYYGGTPNSIMRYLLGRWDLDPRSDVVLVEVGPGAELATLASRQADIAVTTEPFLTQGIRRRLWGEPLYNVPKELGPYAYSTINVRLAAIKSEPDVVRRFVRAMVRSLKFVYENPTVATRVAMAEFPTMPMEDLRATLDRAFADELWSPDGMVLPSAWETAHKVVRSAGILKADVPYDDVVDMRFVQEVLKEWAESGSRS